MTENDLPAFEAIGEGLRAGRSIRDGYVRGWGLEFGDLAARVREDPLYQAAWRVAEGRTVVSEARRMNLFLIARFFLPKLPPGNLVEFGSWRGGNAMFLAHVAAAVSPGTQVFALDTFEGMPPTDRAVDAHSAGDFADADLPSLREAVAAAGLENLHLVPGRFEDTAPVIARDGGPFRLAHIDCDIHSAVAFAYDAAMPALVPGGYVVFDDATISSCLGATEVVEALAIRRDGLHSEQVHPHFVFRAPSP